MSEDSKCAETWRAVVGYEGYYEVSDEGRVRSLTRQVLGMGGCTRTIQGKVLRPRAGGNTRLHPRDIVGLCRDRVSVNAQVHVLVLEAFVGPRPAGLLGCHNDGNPKNNALNNLRWDTPAANMADKIRHGTDRPTTQTHCLRGHRLIGANVRLRWPGHRRCVACSRGDAKVRGYRRRHGIALDVQAESDAYYRKLLSKAERTPVEPAGDQALPVEQQPDDAA